MDKIYFITSREHKFKEASLIIENLEMKDVDLIEIQSMDPYEVIKYKLAEAKKQINGNVIIDDVSAELDALNGFPGPLIKWFVKSLKPEKIAELIYQIGNRSITLRCIIGLSFNGKEYFFEGSINGEIVHPRGTGGFSFGLDPIFQPLSYDKTFAEMSYEEKSRISHRGIAFRKLKDFLDNQK